jgi:uncharacterized protein YbjT (DUF2867 family)
MMDTTPQNPIAVLGASGKTGRRIVDRLRARGLPVRGLSRSASPPFHWQQPETWRPALVGVSAAYVSYFPDLAAPGAPEAVGAMAAAALDAGVKRLVLLSGRGEEEAQRSEDALRSSGAAWTVVRGSWFSQNFSESYFREPLLAGELALPAGDVGEPFVDADDIADVAVAALTEDGHRSETYELTGPRLLTFGQAVEEIARASGRELRYTPLAIDDFAAALARDGVPDEEIGLLRYLFAEVLDGRNAHVADGVERALGRPPRDFADYARGAAARGAWTRHPRRREPSGVADTDEKAFDPAHGRRTRSAATRTLDRGPSRRAARADLESRRPSSGGPRDPGARQ